MSIKESARYDNYMKEMSDKIEVKESPLEEFMSDSPDIESSHPNYWKKHWHGMPEFENEANKDGKFKTMYVHFRTEEDYNEFCELIGQYPSVKSKNNPAIWHPKLDRTANSLLRWMEDNDDNADGT
jgi:hypothetical protein